MDEEKLRRRLAHVRALAAGGATTGEKTAARAAAARLEARLRGTRHPGLPPARLDPALMPGTEATVPTAAALRSAITSWLEGASTPESVAADARRLVDRVVLPDLPPSDPVSIRVETVMLLTTLPAGPIQTADGPALLRFLDGITGDCEAAWRAWFAHLEGTEQPRLGAR